MYWQSLQVYVIISRGGKQLADVYKNVPDEHKLIPKYEELI